ncbi:L domain-like protein [Hyphopichia burtonii NRRL Y-1933]|uniref:L domain-like protein n=1 Tax=Hyphopichia burtonii NRRL Y-1933 TaxID=984485 RepID=A0A1E4RCR5_9ASCO|nr:L domain-like protein [Hyphopichia burtonii NRRL Y-1933]ODV65058.1 L domain-like protein [Hyphopichia burtonii NRRL Y-1933]
MSYIDDFLKKYFFNLPGIIINQICEQIPEIYITNFFLLIEDSTAKDLILEEYNKKPFRLEVSHHERVSALAGYYKLRYRTLVGSEEMVKFFNSHPNINSASFHISCEFIALLMPLIEKYPKRFNNNITKVSLSMKVFHPRYLPYLIEWLPNLREFEANHPSALEEDEDKPAQFEADFNWKNLTKLNIRHDHVEDWSEVKFPPSLIDLDISNCFYINFSTLKIPESVEKFSYCFLVKCMKKRSEYQVGLNGLKLPKNLKVLDIRENELTDINFKQLPANLEEIYLFGNQLETCLQSENIQWPCNLRLIDIRDNQLHDEALSNLSESGWPKNLKSLLLGGNWFESFSSLYNLPDDLEDLEMNLGRNLLTTSFSIGGYPYFRFPTYLKTLDIHKCTPGGFGLMEDSTVRIEFPKTLTNLKMEGCEIEDLSQFIFPPSLESLSLKNNCISDISLYNCGNEINWNNLNNLKELDLSSNQLSNLSSLNIPLKLKKLNLSFNLINELNGDVPIFNDESNKVLHLNYLNLNNNRISFVDSSATSPPRLLRLMLQINAINHLSFNSKFLGSNLVLIDLRYNQPLFQELKRSNHINPILERYKNIRIKFDPREVNFEIAKPNGGLITVYDMMLILRNDPDTNLNYSI